MAYKRELIAQTKNLFDWSGKLREYYDTVNCTIIETLTNGAILQGNIGSEPGTASYENGWFRPGSDEGYGTAVTLSANDVVTISADYEILESNYASPMPIGVYLYGTEPLANQLSQIETGVLYRIKGTYTIAKDGQYYPIFTLNSSKVKITNIQIEKGAAATDYVPYGCLTSYKKILKVSDVCQLLDKREYPETQTINGVTFTNNGDGTITVNSLNITANAYVQLTRYHYIDAKKGHKYCALSGTNRDGGYFYVDILNENGAWLSAIVDDLYTVPNDNYTLRPSIVADKNKPFGDKTYKPQFFDLTEMYGAGNEPATVAEFKAKFPNDLYDYSPRCWVKSYKTGLIAKTKNLFNVNKLTAYTPETLPTNTAGKYNGNIIARANAYNSVSYSHISLKEFCPDLVVGETYSLSFETNATSDQANIIYLSDTDFSWTRGTSKVITENDLTSEVFFYANYPDLTVATISNFQIEKGSVTTDYVPYRYL